MQYTQETNVFCLWPSSAFYEQFVHRITLLIQVSWQKALLSVKEGLRATRTAAQSLVHNLLDQSAACDAVNYLYSVTCMLNCCPDLNPISHLQCVVPKTVIIVLSHFHLGTTWINTGTSCLHNVHNLLGLIYLL